MFVPLQELENLAPGTWYVNVLAAYPEHRGKGCGAALLAVADRLAAEAGQRGLSIIVADTNTGARRLYERAGYREAGKRPMVKEDWQHPGTHWVLLRTTRSRLAYSQASGISLENTDRRPRRERHVPV